MTNISTIKRLGLHCPFGSTFYICEGAWTEFVGCCKTDPCAGDVGRCPTKDLRSASYNPDMYSEIPQMDCSESTLSTVPATWHGGLRELHPRDASWYMECVWDVILTLLPLFFIALAVMTLRLDGRLHFIQGERLDEMTRLSPTIYPVLFASITSRFYKNLSRWLLEQPNGIGLGALEQIFGSHSFAGAFERFIFVRSHIVIGAAILCTWLLSPLGGQGTVRMFGVGKAQITETGIVYYLHPSYQTSSQFGMSEAARSEINVNTLYASNLMSPVSQKRSPRDIWGLPKIPQWPKGIHSGKAYDIDAGMLDRGDAFYVSLLGIEIKGLNFNNQRSISYDFTIETPYINFNCGLVTDNMTYDNYHNFISDSELNLTRAFDYSPSGAVPPSSTTFAVNITGTGQRDAWEDIVIYGLTEHSVLFNCTMETLVVETDVRCGPVPFSTSCSARRQRRVYNQRAARGLFGDALRHAVFWQSTLDHWLRASSSSSKTISSPTDSYLAGYPQPYAGDFKRDWGPINTTSFSSHLTTAFNTFWHATLVSFSHTNVSFESIPPNTIMPKLNSGDEPFMNSTEARATTSYKVYRANRFWVAILLLTTCVLEMMAVIGLSLRFFIHGPDVLGFVSSMTRENKYVGLPPGGSGLGGPDRSKSLREVRVQLADVCPKDEIGYVALKAVSADEREVDPGNQLFGRERLYK
ncbi:hypothetical protein BGZ63DRAFT_366165 [Mariannaea sp. PMI_226]|nr:hypothetical protein BGZ63DRAFT_366165 [Mariannaea sp. PMI_226]